MPNYALYDTQKKKFILKESKRTFGQMVKTSLDWADRLGYSVEVRGQPIKPAGSQPQGYTSKLYTAHPPTLPVSYMRKP